MRATGGKATEGKGPVDFLSILFEVWICSLDFLELPLAYCIMGNVRAERESVSFNQERSWIHSVSVVFHILPIIRSAPVFPPAVYYEKSHIWRAGRLYSELLCKLSLDSTINILLFLLHCLLIPSSIHLIFGCIPECVIGISALQSYTPNVHVIKYSSVFAHGLLPGTRLKIEFPGAIVELLI